MATKTIATASTASGDTTKTLIDTTDIPANATRLICVESENRGAATVTTAESISGKITLESDDIDGFPHSFPIDVALCLVSPAVASRVKNVVDIPLSGRGKIKSYITMDMANTGAIKSTVYYTFEVN